MHGGHAAFCVSAPHRELWYQFLNITGSELSDIIHKCLASSLPLSPHCSCDDTGAGTERESGEAQNNLLYFIIPPRALYLCFPPHTLYPHHCSVGHFRPLKPSQTKHISPVNYLRKPCESHSTKAKGTSHEKAEPCD